MKSSFSDKIYTCLAAKVIKFNGENKTRVTLDQLIRVYKRGEKTSSIFFSFDRSNAQWAMARVNMFLKLSANRLVPTSYKYHDSDISEGSDRTYLQETAEPFWKFSERDFIMARSDLLLAHITDQEAAANFVPPVEEE
tara:strand:- start:1001 stop:1414 length:414 start_codon:yes stop_codon:yes gene_type:complete